MTSPLNVAILAAGQGKRMHSALPKVLHLLAGRPLLAHVLASARALSPRAVVVVIGHGAEAVQSAIAAPDLRFATQDPPKGTGDATRVALDALPPDGVTLVTIGDIPLVPAAALAALVREAEAGKLVVLTAHVPDPSGLGRIVRDGAGTSARHRGRKGRESGPASHRRDQYRRDGCAHGVASPLGGRAQGRQRAERVLPDGHRRACGGGRHTRDHRGRRRARCARHQRSRAVGGGGAHRANAKLPTR